MTILRLYSTPYIDERLIPQLDSMANDRNCSRADIIRDILYSKLNYIPPKKSMEQIKEIYELEKLIEQSYKKENGNSKCIAIYIDPGFEILIEQQQMYDLYQSSRIEKLLCECFGIECKLAEYEVIGTSSTPGKSIVRVKRVSTITSL